MCINCGKPFGSVLDILKDTLSTFVINYLTFLIYDELNHPFKQI